MLIVVVRVLWAHRGNLREKRRAVGLGTSCVRKRQKQTDRHKVHVRQTSDVQTVKSQYTSENLCSDIEGFRDFDFFSVMKGKKEKKRKRTTRQFLYVKKV